MAQGVLIAADRSAVVGNTDEKSAEVVVTPSFGGSQEKSRCGAGGCGGWTLWY